MICLPDANRVDAVYHYVQYVVGVRETPYGEEIAYKESPSFDTQKEAEDWIDRNLDVENDEYTVHYYNTFEWEH